MLTNNIGVGVTSSLIWGLFGDSDEWKEVINEIARISILGGVRVYF